MGLAMTLSSSSRWMSPLPQGSTGYSNWHVPSASVTFRYLHDPRWLSRSLAPRMPSMVTGARDINTDHGCNRSRNTGMAPGYSSCPGIIMTPCGSTEGDFQMRYFKSKNVSFYIIHILKREEIFIFNKYCFSNLWYNIIVYDDFFFILLQLNVTHISVCLAEAATLWVLLRRSSKW